MGRAAEPAASAAPRPLEPGHLVSHRALQRLGEGIVQVCLFFSLTLSRSLSR